MPEIFVWTHVKRRYTGITGVDLWEEECDAIDAIILQCVKKDYLETKKDPGQMHCTRHHRV